MRIDGQWLICDDGAVRPVARGEVQAANGAWLTVEFLVDTGADRTALSADVFAKLGLSPLGAPGRLTGIGGGAASVEVETFLRLFTAARPPPSSASAGPP